MAAEGNVSEKPREAPIRAAQTEPVETVSEFTRRVKALLEGGIRPGWVRGEVSNLRAQASGHVYFSLKDSGAQFSAVLFRGDAARQKVPLRDGLQVVVFGEINLYEVRGQYQLIVRAVVEDGVGRLQREFEALKQRLAAEGLFAPEKKRPIPLLPGTVGFITSPTGAAVQRLSAHSGPARMARAHRHPSGQGSGSRSGGRDGCDARTGGPPGDIRPARHWPGRGKPGGSLGLQRGAAGSRHRRLSRADRFGRGPRDRFHPFGFCRRCAGGDAQRRGELISSHFVACLERVGQAAAALAAGTEGGGGNTCGSGSARLARVFACSARRRSSSGAGCVWTIWPTSSRRRWAPPSRSGSTG